MRSDIRFPAEDTPPSGQPTVLDVLALDEVGPNAYRSTLLFADERPLYGGQVAAQALYAAGRTVSPARVPHSLHGYFLRSGDPAHPTEFRVDRDRDGGSFSARRVVARQEGKVIFCMAASFQAPGVGPDHQVHVPPDVPHPDELPRTTLGRLFSMESRLPPQPFATTRWPTRFWARCSVPLPEDPLVHACVLTYLSDVSTGLSALRDESAVPGPSLDHAVWFHRPVELDCWVLMDLQPRTTAGGRGFYAGSICSQDGTLAASFVQESLFRPARSPLGAPGPRSPDVDGRHGGAARVAEKGKCT